MEIVRKQIVMLLETFPPLHTENWFSKNNRNSLQTFEGRRFPNFCPGKQLKDFFTEQIQFRFAKFLSWNFKIPHCSAEMSSRAKKLIFLAMFFCTLWIGNNKQKMLDWEMFQSFSPPKLTGTFLGVTRLKTGRVKSFRQKRRRGKWKHFTVSFSWCYEDVSVMKRYEIISQRFSMDWELSDFIY